MRNIGLGNVRIETINRLDFEVCDVYAHQNGGGKSRYGHIGIILCQFIPVCAIPNTIVETYLQYRTTRRFASPRVLLPTLSYQSRLLRLS